MPPRPIASVAAAWCLAAALACAADHPPGKLLFEEDFSGREAGTIEFRGDGWSMAEGVLSQAREVGSRGAEIGDKSWKDLDVTFRVRARKGKKGHMIGLTGRGVWFAVREDLFQMVAGKRSAARQARQSSINRWVNVRVVFQGRAATFFADGERVGTLDAKSASGPVSLSTNGMAGDFDDVRVIVPEKGEKGLAGPPKAKNLLPNGSFEDVVDNMPVWWAPAPPFLDRYGTHKELRYRFGVRPDKSAPHGQRCLVMRGHTPYKGFLRLPADTGKARWRGFLRLPTGRPLVLSMYMRAQCGEGKLPVWVKGTFAKATFLVGPEWERFVFHSKGTGTDRNQLSIEMRTGGVLWIDAVQVEEGTEVTAFEPHPNDGKNVHDNTGAIVINENVPEATVAPAAGPIKLDGKLDEAAWANTAHITEFHGGGRPITVKTEARICHDDENLYIAYTCHDPDMANLLAKQTRRDGPTFLDDCVETMIDADRDGRTYFNFCANAIGTQTDGIGFDYSWDGDWESRAARVEDGWTIELKFPLANFDISPGTPAVWGVNLCREHPRKKELPRWAPTSATSFHEPTNYARLRWKDPSVFRKFFFGLREVRLLEVPGETGKAALTGSVKNNTADAVRGYVRLKVDGQAYESPRIEMKPGKWAAFEVSDLELASHKALPLLVQVVTDRGRLRRSTSLMRKVLPVVDAFAGRSYYSCEPEAEIVCDVNIPSAQAKGLVASLSLKRGDKELWKGAYRVRPGRNFMNVPMSGRGAGAYEVYASFANANKAVLAESTVPLRKADFRKGETKIDHVARIMLKDGTPYIPFMNLFGGYSYEGENTFRELSKAGFDAVMLTYCWHRKEFPEQMGMDNMRLAETHGLNYVLFHGAPHKQPPGPEWADRIGRIGRERPGLIGWLVMDEPWDHPELTIDAVEKAKAADPNRVVYVNHHVPMVLKQFAGLPGDAVSTDHYVTANPGRRIENVALYTRQFEEIARQRHVPTYFFISGGSGYYAPRESTPGELTAQVYGHLAAGGNGIFAFIGGFIAPSTWECWKQLNREVKALTPVLASRGTETVPQVPDPAPEIITGTWKHNGTYYVVASNQSVRTIKATFDLGALQLGRGMQATVLFEARAVRVANCAIVDRFRAFERHVYRIVP